MFAHECGDALAASLFADDIAGIADVGAEAGLVRLKVIGAEDGSVGFGNVSRGVGVDPAFAGVGFGDVGRIGASFAGAEDGFKDLPDGGPVSGFEFADSDQDCDEGEFAARK